jgi:transposase
MSLWRANSQGKVSTKWQPGTDAAGNEAIFVRFARADCAGCAQRSLCTKSKTAGRELSLRPEAQYLALQSARQCQKSSVFLKDYGLRAGIEGTLSQGVRTCGMRRSRYIGETKTHLQHVMIAAALNLLRMVSWLMKMPLATTRRSSLVALALRLGVPARLCAT